jgi:kojibiose phosphorylase
MKPFSITYDTFDPKRENYRESIFTLSNTVMGMRGIEDEGTAAALPGLYIAGLFDQSECIAPEIVNFPDILPVWLEVGGEKIAPDTCAVKEYRRELDMQNGVLLREVTFATSCGDCTVQSRRFLSFADKQCGAIEYRFTFADYSGPVCVKTSFDACQPSREGSYQYDETVKHFNLIRFNDQYAENFYARIQLRDRGTLVDFVSFAALSVPALRRSRKIFYEKNIETIDLNVTAKTPCTVTKYFVIADSRDLKPDELNQTVLAKLERMKRAGFTAELDHSAFVLSNLWKNADVTIEGDDEMQRMLRYNIYQLIGLGAEHSSAFAIGAKGLSTEHYGGHYFWDTEIYLLPFYLNTNPAVARNLLEFRFRTLETAKQRARAQGFEGCLWPWQSDELGNEGIRQTVTPDGRILRRDILDQYHVVSDVAYACLHYYHQTGDEFFLRTKLMPVLVESMRFWKSFLLKQNKADAAEYHIRNVMGPDEYHTDVSDNYYTNFLTRYLFEEFSGYMESATPKQRLDIEQLTGLTGAELADFQSIAKKIHLPPVRDGVLEQFDGYFKRKDLPITEYSPLGMPRYPDPSVGAGLPDAERQDALQRHATQTQLIKQADAVLPLYLLPEKFTPEQIKATFAYYDQRTLQYSSLSPGVCAIVGAKAGAVERAYPLFRLGASMDLCDVKHETETGLHTACHGGTYMGAIGGFAGVQATEDYLEINPHLPPHWSKLAFTICYKGARVNVECAGKSVAVRADRPVALKINGTLHNLTSTGVLHV